MSDAFQTHGAFSWCELQTDDVDKRAAAATAGGAELLGQPFDVPGVGRIATMKDPFGALISLITYEKKD